MLFLPRFFPPSAQGLDPASAAETNPQPGGK